MKVLIAICLALPLYVFAENDNYLDVESPNVFHYNSPLRQPDSLRSRPYFDFLSTLYRHDNTKTDLFRPYLRQRRDVGAASSAQVAPIVESPAEVIAAHPEVRQKRAILFRPLFVYRQQQVRRQEAAKRRKRV